MRRALAAAAISLIALPMYGADLWLHVAATTTRHKANRVTVNLPMRAIARALPLAPKGHPSNRCIEVDGRQLSMTEIRDALTTLRGSQEGVVVTRTEGESKLEFSRVSGVLRIVSNDGFDRSEMLMPVELAEALTSGTGDDPNLAALSGAIVRRGAGEVMRINSEESNVRIWVDLSPTSSAQLAAAPAW